MARRGYPSEFRRRVIELIERGKKVAEEARNLDVRQQTFYVWRRQARIDAGLETDVKTAEFAERAAARNRIRELETGFAIHCRATELLKEAPRGPKRSSRRSR